MGFTVTALSARSIRVEVEHIPGFSYYEIAYRPSYTETATFLKMQAQGDFSRVIEGLEAGQTYVVNVAYSSHDGNYVFLGPQRVSLPAAAAVEHWVWPAGYEDMLSGGKALSGFSYTVWNALCDKVVAIHQAHGSYIRWLDDRLTLQQTKMTGNDRTLTAQRFNSLRFNIGSHYSTGLPEVSSGQPVPGSYFLTLGQAINHWIDTWF